jgi:4-diphosphocytidyl-2C-methyl-D-erythritol kinase
VLAVPPHRRQAKTRYAYARVSPRQYSDGSATARFLAVVDAKCEVEPGLAFNAFDLLVDELYPELGPAWARLAAYGLAPHLAGSGPAFFCVPTSGAAKEAVTSVLAREFRFKVITAHTTGPIAATGER